MASLKIEIVIGVLGDKMHRKALPNSTKQVFTASVATHEGYGENRKTTWNKINIWNEKEGSYLLEKARKGDTLCVVGTPVTKEWNDKMGNKRTSFEINALKCALIPKGGFSSEVEESMGSAFSDPSKDLTAPRVVPMTDSDIPF